MSYLCLVIPEDPTYNGYILKPLISRVLAECGKENAKITVLTNPFMKGYEFACQNLESICFKYAHFNLILFLPDRDGKEGRDIQLQNFEQKYSTEKTPFITCAAIEEVEVWLMAGYIEKLNDSWPTIRSDVSSKENYFQPFIDKHGDNSPGQGREKLMKAALSGFAGILERCPELKTLRQKIDDSLQ